MQSQRMLAASALSLLGHPALLVPAAFMFNALGGASPAEIRLALSGSAFVAVGIVAYSWIQVRTGRWSHVDASAPGERRQINRFLVLLFFGIAGLMLVLGKPRSLVMGPALSGGLVALGHLLRRRLKVSLHTSFAAFAALLIWPSTVGTFAAILLALAVAWSRLALSRHTPHEVGAGLLAGAVAGLAFNLTTS